MLDNIKAYSIQFIQKVSSSPNDTFDFCMVYCFYTEPKDKASQRLKYIIRAEAHRDVFAIKFYATRDKHLDYKYNRILDTHSYIETLRIFYTCASLIPILMKDYPEASFIVNGARSIDVTNKIEDGSETQRFRIYRTLATMIVGEKTFIHYQFKEVSSYLLLRKKNGIDIEEDKNRVKNIFLERYGIEDMW